jgi:acetyltransferase-like isoleucine patch superfamily enzyme
MINKLFGMMERIKKRWLRFYRLRVFEYYTNQRTDRCSILGPITLINHNVRIGKNVTFYPNVMLFGDGIIEIGDNVDIGNNTIIYAKAEYGGVKISSNSMIAANCYIIDSNHGIVQDILMREQPLDSSPIIIGEDVWIGTDCQVLKGRRIDSGAVIGAGSLVNRDIPANAIAAGIPARILKYRSQHSTSGNLDE